MDNSKLGLNHLKKQSLESLKNNKQAQAFINAANATATTDASTEISTTAQKHSNKKLIVEGILKNREKICQRPMQLYVLNSTAEWVKENASAGRGGQQVLLNYLIKRGIESVEEQFKNEGFVLAEIKTNET